MLHPSTDIIMNAQQFFAADQSEANLVKLLHAVSVMLQEGAEVLIPTAADAPEGQLLLQTQTTDSGLEYMTAYSSKEAYEQGKPCNVISRPLVNYFEAILQMDGIAGIIFNPASPAPFNIQKMPRRTSSRTLFLFGAVILLRWTATQLSMLPTVRF